jgi:hypothetical protein
MVWIMRLAMEMEGGIERRGTGGESWLWIGIVDVVVVRLVFGDGVCGVCGVDIVELDLV